MQQIFDKNIVSYRNLISPTDLKENLPLLDKARKAVIKGRDGIERILDDKDDRIFILLGPCSVHNIKEAYEYAQKLKKLAKEVEDQFLLVMRTYFEKPRTSLGWPGLIESPYFQKSNCTNTGLELARKLLLDIAELGLPTATEFLNIQTPQYIDDLISYAALGARSVELPQLRKMVSGLSMPAGVKNSTDGRIDVAVNAIKVAQSPNTYIAMDQHGRVSCVETKGNNYGHIILRGGADKPNYDAESVKSVQEYIKDKGLPTRIVVDCSHDNSRKDHRNQPKIFEEVIAQRRNGNNNIKGIMLESYLYEGNQPIVDYSKLRYGISVTDACISWETTEKLIRECYRK